MKREEKIDTKILETDPNLINQLILRSGVDINKVSDGYHTFKELYDHRIALFIALCGCYEDMASELGEKQIVWKSKTHHDGTSWDGWFIMGLDTRKGKQISYHLPNEYWDRLDWVPTVDKAPEWDGHTPSDVVERLLKL